MSKNLNKVRDMKHTKYARIIRGDEIRIRRIALMYSDFNPNLVEETEVYYDEFGDYHRVPTGYYRLVFSIEMDVWNKMVKDLGLIRVKEVSQKRLWEIA